ncbi:MAG: AI-2E family transporter [Planctomycetes bacterium]|jgi:predicted PurR-regulated permease PerM|nr:AI-2E family transporter [Planctomycetota bacterium]
MPSASEHPEKTLPPPWDRIFSLTTRAFVWGLLIAVLYVLRPFLLLVFMTFVFAYIQAHGVDGLAHRIKNRPARVIIVGLVFLGTLFATGFTLVPEIQSQANTFWENREKYIKQGDQELSKFLKQYPALYKSLAKHQQGTGLPDPITAFGDNKVPGTIPRPKPPEPTPEDGKPADGSERRPEDGSPKTGADRDGKPLPTDPKDGTNGNADGSPADSEKPAEKLPENLFIVRDLLNNVIESLAKNPLEIGQSVIGYASSFLLSLLFSFLIVLDLSKIRRGITGLANTKIGFIYDEVADNIAGFGRVLGRALEAQLFIAICNTILTSLGLWMLGLTQSMLVLSAIVFVCSFIPVVGTFLSSTPICLLALQSGGVSTMVLAILMICLVHALETYVLNPQIYGHHMHMNPVLVLIVLTIGGKLFGVWGLILGIPIVNYVFRHAIRKPEERPAET